MNPLLPDTDSEDELPPEWEQKISLTNRIYYVNHRTNKTQWTHPLSGKQKSVSGKLPEGWQRKVDDEGNVVSFFNVHTNQTTYTDPRLGSAFETSDMRNTSKKELGPNSTTEDVLSNMDLHGKVAIVTGANGGIGFETAKALILHGAFVFIACRDSNKANEAIKQIKNELGENALVEFIHCDLASLKSIKQCCQTFLEKDLHLDMLILNAAAMGLPYTITEDGYEATFQVNHLGHFLMVRLLEEKLIESKTRVVFVSSESHRFSTMNVDNIFEEWSETDFISFMAYNDSKLCNVLMAKELDRRLGNKNVTAVSCHPGNLVFTDLHRYWWVYWLLYWFVRLFTKTPNQGAATVVYCATTNEIRNIGGLYFNNCQECEPMASANDPELARLLWDKSDKMIKPFFP